MRATTALFTDDFHHFTLLYPKGVDVHSYDDGEGSHTFTFEGPSPGEGFQIFIVPYTETVITPARFKIDDPSDVMEDAATTTVVHILDYKPDARTNKPIAQLTVYALALSRLTGIRLFDIKCAWFNENEYCEFFPRTLLSRERPRRVA